MRGSEQPGLAGIVLGDSARARRTDGGARFPDVRSLRAISAFGKPLARSTCASHCLASGTRRGQLGAVSARASAFSRPSNSTTRERLPGDRAM